MLSEMVEIATLSGVEKTLLIPLWARAKETQGRGSIRDELSVQLINRINIEEFGLDNLSPFVRNYLLTAIANRTILIDKYLNRILDSQTIVVNLGCGLDTRYIRYIEKVKHWYDFDLDNVISLRKKLVDEVDNYSMLAGSLLDEELFDKIGHKNIVCICEGLLMYFDEATVREFVDNIVSKTESGYLIMETLGNWTKFGVNPVISKIGEKSKYTWTINNQAELLKYNDKLELLATESIFDINKLNWKIMSKIAKSKFLRTRISSNITMLRY